jgi:signal transduction histidine kinase
MKMKQLQIADRLFYGIVAMIVIVLGGLGSVIIHQRVEDVTRRMEKRLDVTVVYLEQALPRPAARLDAKKMRHVIEAAGSDELQAVEIFDNEREMVYVYERAGREIVYDKKIERNLVYNDKPAGSFAAYFSIENFVRDMKIREFLRLIIMISAAGLVFGAGLYHLVKRIVVKPIDRTLAFSEGLAGGDYQKRIDISTDDEMGKLQHALNQMADSMQETMENLKSSFYEAEGARLQALEASRLKSEFLASMSHEIRTPLNAIIGFADLLLEEEKDDEKKEALLTIKKSANILFENITDVLDFSKIEAGKLRISKTEFLIRDVVDEIGPIIKLRLHGKDVAFDFKIDEALERPLISDRVRIRQILLNVLINSAKFTHKGRISLTITPAQEMEGVLFKIEDTGIGIPESEHTRVFEPFTQVEGGVTREYGGTGLGLAIAKRLVEMLGGRIWLESKPGDGTAIYFTVEV